jgi:TRAP-type C4-dicarboxylate transport system permease small subunit
MINSALIIFLGIAVILVVVIGLIILQIFLSKKKNKWIGLILPMICFIFSIVVVAGIGSYTTLNSTVTVKESDESGNIVNSQTVTKDLTKDMSVGKSIAYGAMIFIIYNIPTIVLIGIYYASREKQRIESAVDKMKIKDL